MKTEAVCYILTFVKDSEEKKYIGHTTNLEKRILRHCSSLAKGKHHNSILQRLYNDGWRYDGCPDIFPMPTKELANAFEQSLIVSNRNNSEVVNIECGNDTYTNNPNKEEIRTKLIRHLITWKNSLSEEERQKFYSKPGEHNGMFGRTHSVVSRALISDKLSAYYSVNESANKGKPKSDEHRAIMSRNASLRFGVLNPFYGRTHSEETKKKISEINKGKLPANTRKVYINDKVYESITEAGRQLGVHTTVVLFRVKSLNSKFSHWKWFEMPND